MANLRVYIHKGGKLETTVTVPGKMLKAAPKLVPAPVVTSLREEGIDLGEILTMAAKPEINGTLFELEQHASNSKIIIAVE